MENYNITYDEYVSLIQNIALVNLKRLKLIHRLEKKRIREISRKNTCSIKLYLEIYDDLQADGISWSK